jgi:hypothetical protein
VKERNIPGEFPGNFLPDFLEQQANFECYKNETYIIHPLPSPHYG